MNTFITENDYTKAITLQELLRITEGDISKFTDFEITAIDKASSSLAKIYNLEKTFAKTGNERDMGLVLIILHLMVYYTCSTHNTEQMTETIADNYSYAISDLKKIAKGETVLTKAVKINEPEAGAPPPSSEDVHFHYSPKRDNIFF